MLHVVAAAVVRDRRLLLVSKRAAPDLFYLPGGKPEPGEAAEATLRREVREELGAELTALTPFAVVQATAALEGVPMQLTVYRADLVGTPAAAAEIAAVTWWPDGREHTLASAIAQQVVPRLAHAGLLEA